MLIAFFCLSACQPVGPEGFFVELYGKVVDQYQAGLEDVDITLARSDSALIGTAITNNEGWYSIPVFSNELSSVDLRVMASKDGYSSASSWFNLTLLEGSNYPIASYPPHQWATYSRQIPGVRLANEGQGELIGELVDASSGEPLQNVKIYIVPDWNSPLGSAHVVSVTTGSGSEAGIFSVPPIDSGTYTAFVDEDSYCFGTSSCNGNTKGYFSSKFPIFIPGGDTGSIIGAVSPTMGADELRTSLTWRGYPADLDLHLTGPKSGIQSGDEEWERFHIWSEQPNHPANASDVHDKTAYMEIIEDGGGGLESATVADLKGSGSYRVGVFDVINESSPNLRSLSNSWAVIQLWTYDQVHFFEISPDQDGNTWLAFDWDQSSGIIYRLQECSEGDPDQSSTF